MAERTEILNELDALSSHCRVSLMSVEQRTGWMRDWCEDLGKFKIEDIRKVFRDWRQSGNIKFPTPGQVMPILRKLAAMTNGATDSPKAWRELSEAEYQALDLPEKERHHLILAARAEVEAGPMWKTKDRRLTLDEMPQRWHDLRAKAVHHRAEARQLRDLYRRQERQA